MRVFASNVSGQPISQLASQDIAVGIQYALFGNDYCSSNSAPVAIDDLAVGPTNTPLEIDVLANDSDPEGDALTITQVSEAAHGTVVDNGDGTVTYTPENNFSGEDFFTYRITDGSLEDQAIVTVRITNTTCSEALVFGDGFEDGTFDAWDRSKLPERLQVSAEAALFGEFGLEVAIEPEDSGSFWILKDEPQALRYCFSFLFDPNSISMPSGESFAIFGAGHLKSRNMRLGLNWNGAQYRVIADAKLDDGSLVKTGFHPFPDAPAFIEGEWIRSDGGDNGEYRIYLDGELVFELTGLDNDTVIVDRMGLGVVQALDEGVDGTFFIDEFNHFR